MSEITVVGGGISGLVAAYRLSGDHRVTVLEAGDRLGGCLKATTLDGAVPVGIDTGAEASLNRRPETKGLAAELGLHSVFPSTQHSSQVLSRGDLHAIPKRTIMGVPAEASEVEALIGAEAAARLAAERITPPIEGDDVSLGDFLSARLGGAIVDALVDPLLGGVYAGRCRDLSLAETVPALLPAAVEGTSVLDLVAQLLNARDAKTASAGSPEPVFMSFEGGINSLIPALHQAIVLGGGTVRLGAGVTGIDRDGEKWIVRGEGGDIESDGLVLATPAHVTAGLLRPVAPESAGRLGEIPSASTALVAALVDLGGIELEGSGFLVPATEGTFIKASTFVSNKWPWTADHIPAGTALVRMSIGRFGDGPEVWSSLSDEEIIQRAFADWQTITSRPESQLLGSEVQRWDSALPQYLPGHAGRIAAVDAEIAGLPGLELAGSAFGGVGIPACTARADAAAQRLNRPADDDRDTSE
ncbi:protoporphyrinogen oxidase [Brevibacterium linens]|uniref:Coproporphyrinogen III oxidase n=1 Tax=Brevibacterium linens ATCC 9172 TaxID=1255617 RepID=A0A2H1HIM3_BRELN|nr:protoporphyrinogen oxidase [Brevibacterium linens]KAB1949481.1 protoporphyrinogen oxidase [Brevibacterium linens ATCC 9172]SMX62768.1 oxygen-dependent protoporphyrinogen oxidase [Brevibacterium linens ATCC 9172]